MKFFLYKQVSCSCLGRGTVALLHDIWTSSTFCLADSFQVQGLKANLVQSDLSLSQRESYFHFFIGTWFKVFHAHEVIINSIWVVTCYFVIFIWCCGIMRWFSPKIAMVIFYVLYRIKIILLPLVLLSSLLKFNVTFLNSGVYFVFKFLFLFMFNLYSDRMATPVLGHLDCICHCDVRIFVKLLHCLGDLHLCRSETIPIIYNVQVIFLVYCLGFQSILNWYLLLKVLGMWIWI
jgi:hypothetical protein